MPAKSDRCAYPYLIRHQQVGHYLLWMDGGKEKDYLLCQQNGQLLVANSLQVLQQLAPDLNAIKIVWDDASELDLDLFWLRLKNLRAGRATSSATNKLLLEGWNFLEDLAHSFALPRDLAIFTEPGIQKIYDKFFWGCNLAATTPAGKSYAPIFLNQELTELRRAIKQLWQALLKKAPELA